MKGWEAELPATFPIERLHRDAIRDAHRRRTRRRQRYQGAMAGVCALLVIALGVLAANRDAQPEQVQAGPGPTGATSSVSKSNGRIAFIRSTGPEDPAPKIYVMDEDGSGQTMIAETTRGGSLTWSPDGTKLAFDDVGGIYTVNADGTGETRVPTTSHPDQWPSWSPDGTKLAVRIFEGRTAAIDIVNIDGSGRRRLITGDVAHPAWSPDGSRIAYHSGRELYVVNVDGSSRRKLTSTGGYDDEPAWSPDGRQIAFRHNNTIKVINAEGGTTRQLVSHGGPALADPTGRGGEPAVGRGTPATPQWSPDGRKIIYALSQTGEACSIWIMNADGSGRSQLTDGRTCDRDPAWQSRLS